MKKNEGLTQKEFRKIEFSAQIRTIFSTLKVHMIIAI